MPTWQIFPDGGNTYRWIISGQYPTKKLQEESRRTLIHHENPNSRLPSMEHLLIQESWKLFPNCGGGGGVYNDEARMFQTASGKPIEAKQSPLFKASSALDNSDHLSIRRDQIHATNNGHRSCTSLFQTGSGKMVHLSSAGLIKAKTLLGLEESSGQFVADESNVWEKLPNVDKRDIGQIHENVDPISVSRHPLNGQTDVYSTGYEQKELLPNFLFSQLCNSSDSQPPVMFQTASGRSISVSNNALQRAVSLLRDSDLGDLARKEGADGPELSLHGKEISNRTSLNKENDLFASSLQHKPTKKKFASKPFPPPKAHTFKQNQGFTTIKASSSSNFVKQICEDDSVCKELYESNSNIAGTTNSLSTESVNPAMHVEDPLAKQISPRTNQLRRSSLVALVDISNNIGIHHANHKQILREKRELVKRSTVSPFKRPRSTWFSTPKSSTNQ